MFHDRLRISLYFLQQKVTERRLTHEQQHPPRLLAPLHAARIGVETMATPAACRTFNILSGEGRRVVAALIVTA